MYVLIVPDGTKSVYLSISSLDANPQIDENEELVKRLEEETASLKEEVARLHSDLSSEREKLEEVMSAYAAENEEAMNEFVSLKSEKEDLMAERDALLAKVGRLDPV